jgi:hypothetical protein
MADSNTPYFGMMVKFFQPKIAKKWPRHECLKALPEVKKRVWELGTEFGGPQSRDGVENEGQNGHSSYLGQRRIASVRTPRPGHRGSDPGDRGPVGGASWRRRPGKATFRVPGASALRVISSQIANGRVSLPHNFNPVLA